MKFANVRLKVRPFSNLLMVLMLIPVFSDTSFCDICIAIRVSLYLCPNRWIILAGVWFCASSFVIMAQR